MTLFYVMFTFLCTSSAACYAMRSVMSQINEYDDDDDDDDVLAHCLYWRCDVVILSELFQIAR